MQEDRTSRRIALIAFMFWDVLVAAGAWAVAAACADGQCRGPSGLPFAWPSPIWFAAVTILGWHLVMVRLKMYHSRRLGGVVEEQRDVVVAAAVMAGLMAVGVLVLAPHYAQGRFLVTFAVLLLCVTAASRIALRLLLAFVRVRGRNLRLAIIAGSGYRAGQLARQMLDASRLGYRVLGYVDDEPHGGMPRSLELLGGTADLPRILAHTAVDEVFIALPTKSRYGQIQTVVDACELQGVPVTLLADVFTVRLSRTDFTTVAGSPVMRLVASPELSAGATAKRYLDFLFAAVALFLLWPVMLVIAIAIRATSPGPAIFKQTRMGLNKRLFTMYKFRTMVSNAERRQTELESLNEASGPAFKMKADPRVTPLGAFLRKTSLDELPQLFNVLKGDMSMVGPRPLPLRDVAGFSEDWHRRRFSVLPGITCLWQLSGRSDLEFDEWMALDMEYIDNWSLGLDFSILLRTVRAVVRRDGAY